MFPRPNPELKAFFRRNKPAILLPIGLAIVFAALPLGLYRVAEHSYRFQVLMNREHFDPVAAFGYLGYLLVVWFALFIFLTVYYLDKDQ